MLKQFLKAIPAACVLLLPIAHAAVDIQLTPSVASPRPIGTRVLLTASIATDPTNVVMRFEARDASGQWRMLQDFRDKPYFEWSSLESRTHLLRVYAEDEVTGETGFSVIPYTLVSQAVVAGQPVISPTPHPLVLLYSGPPCPAGSIFRVRFWPAGESPSVAQTTHPKACRPAGVAHYIGGMRSNTDYVFRGEVFDGVNLTAYAPLIARPGALPDFLTDFAVVQPAGPTTSTADAVHLTSYTRARDDGNFWVATDLQGRLVWAYGQLTQDIFRAVLFRPKAGGTFLGSFTEASGLDQQFIREVDLVGNTVRETGIPAVNRQLTALSDDNVGSFHHEARPLANGHTLVFASVERVLTDIQGPGDVNVYGEMVIDLDRNFQVAWTWNAFDHLDTSEVAILGEICVNGQGGCPVLQNEPANDWLHMNSIAYSPDDGHIVLSARHHDTVYKIDYANGTGSGDVVWRLGNNGSFAIDADPGEAWPWFSHQHDAQYQNGLFVLYDNGNVRRDQLGTLENSRGQVYQLDEVNLVATLVHNFNLGEYSLGLGSAQRLRNGNYHFDRASLVNQTFAGMEMSPDSGLSFAVAGGTAAYRSFRMKSLYEP